MSDLDNREGRAPTHSMDRDEVRRLAEGYRQMRDEQLAALLVEQGTLTEEARQALLDVVAERPDVPRLQQRLIEEAQNRAARQAEKEAEKEVKRQARLASERPGAGLWLWLLTVVLCGLALRCVYIYVSLRMSEAQLPELLETEGWLPYKILSLGLALSALIAGGIAIHGIHVGTTRSHLRRVIACLWYVSPVVLLVSLAASGFLFGFDHLWSSSWLGSAAIHLVLTVLNASLWTAYLVRSQRCRRRYPKRTAEMTVVQVFE